ncbi:MAG: pyrroline-5-carboxylate reductase, partial [Bacillota bacterium]
MDLDGLQIGSLGGGAMAEALLAGLIESGFPPADLFASDIQRKRLAYLQKKLGINPVEDNGQLVEKVDVAVLAVKPQIVGRVLAETGEFFRSGQTLISIAAGVPIKYIEGFLKNPVGVVRVMPNTPCLVGAGASALCAGTYAREEDLRRAKAIFNAVGRVAEVSEELMDAVTGLSGSGPAYMFLILDALADAGVRAGLPRETALLLSAQTMFGAARMVLEKGENPAKLKDMVTTPAGTTIEGIFALEEGGLRRTLMKAVSEATRRA